jgi:cell division protein FtsB
MAEADPKRPVLARVWIGVAIVAVILVLGDLNRRMADALRLERESAVAQTVVASLESENARLQTQIVAATSGALVEEWARRESKMVRPGEHLMVPIPPQGGTPQATPSPTSRPLLPSRWDVWWELLFGS